MKNKKLYIVVVFMLFSINMIGQGKSKIIGKLKESKGDTVYLTQIVNNKFKTIDSCVVNRFGKYKFSLKVEKHEFYNLTKDRKQSLLLFLKGKERIKISSLSSFEETDYKIKGSKESQQIQKYFAFKESKSITKDSLDKFAMEFIKKNRESIVVFLAFSDLKNPLEGLKIAEKGVGKTYPDSDYHKNIKNAIASLKQREAANRANKPGFIAPEINLTSPQGKKIALSSLRGKYVLIDFWASWCRPCRNENPNVVRLYNKYKDKGFEVYSVSLDRDKNRWEKAIKADGLVWENHVSDLKGWSSQASRLYRINSIPYTVLIDKNGKIIGQRLRGAALENKLKEIFGE